MAYQPNNPNGQAVMSASAPVVIASNQSAVQVLPEHVNVASGTITTQNLVPAGAATVGSAVTLTTTGHSAVAIQVTGTYTGQLSLQATINGTTWVTLSAALSDVTGTAVSAIQSATQSLYSADVSGFAQVRVTGLAAVTGTATVTISSIPGSNRARLGTLPVTVQNVVPTSFAEYNHIGMVGVALSQLGGTITAVNAFPASANPTNFSTAGGDLVTTSGGSTMLISVPVGMVATLNLQVGIDSTTFLTVGGTPFYDLSTGVWSAAIVATGSGGIWQCDVSGFLSARVSCSAYGGGGGFVTTVFGGSPTGGRNPTTIPLPGQTTMSASLPVVLASDQSSVKVSQTPVATAVLTNATSSATTAVVKAANANRRGFLLHNDSTAILYLAYASTASLTAYTVKIPPDGYWEMPIPVYTGALAGIWSAANGFARITETS